jgi:hypothetical protein
LIWRLFGVMPNGHFPLGREAAHFLPGFDGALHARNRAVARSPPLISGYLTCDAGAPSRCSPAVRVIPLFRPACGAEPGDNGVQDR